MTPAPDQEIQLKRSVAYLKSAADALRVLARRPALTAVIQEAYVQGISTRSVDELVKAMRMEGIGIVPPAEARDRQT